MKFPAPQALEEGKVSQLNQLMQEAQVKNFLANHPDFLMKNPELLTHMELNQQCDQTTSLVERQIKVLRDKNLTLQGQLIEMLQAAHNNESLLIQCNQFMLELLSIEDLPLLCEAIIQKLKKDFQLDAVSLILVGDYPTMTSAKVMSEAAGIKNLLNCQFPDNQPLCGRLEKEAKVELFGELNQHLDSFALVPLGDGCSQGLLALASTDVERFEPQMGTLFVELIAKLVAHLAERHGRA